MTMKPGRATGALVLSALLLAAPVSASTFWMLAPESDPMGLSLDFDPWMIQLPECLDMALGPMQSILFITGDGHLLLVDGPERIRLDGSLVEEVWPEALGADGSDWLVLHRLGGELLRLGRRGEDLGRVQLPQGRWREMEVCRSGRIWLADPAGERFLALGRGGQTLQDWNLQRLLPGRSGHLDSWATDGEGGLALAVEGRVYHLNAAGNLAASWQLPEFLDRPSLVAVGDGRILAMENGDEAASLLYRKDLGLLLLGDGGRRVLGSPDIPEPAP